jgi:hypothetical protein
MFVKTRSWRGFVDVSGAGISYEIQTSHARIAIGKKDENS